MTMPNDKSSDDQKAAPSAANALEDWQAAELEQQIRKSNAELDRIYTAIQINKAVFPRSRTFKH